MARHERDGGRPVGPVETGEPLVEPVPDHPAATARLGGERALVVADYHAGIEVGLRHERGIELDSASDQRRERLLSLLDQTDTDRLVVVISATGCPASDRRSAKRWLRCSTPSPCP